MRRTVNTRAKRRQKGQETEKSAWGQFIKKDERKMLIITEYLEDTDFVMWKKFTGVQM